MAFLIGGANSAAADDYNIENSLRINDADNSYLAWTPGSDGDLDKWTLSMWVKRTVISTYDYIFTVADNGNNTVIVLYADDGIRFEHYDGSQLGMLTTNRVFRDPTAWYHFVFVWDTGNGTAGDRQRLYVNGVEETSFATDTQPSQDQDGFVSDASYAHWFGRGSTQTAANNLDGYLAEVAFCDGQTYAASDFGKFDSDSGIWKPKDFKNDVTFGSQGYYLEFKETGTSQNSSGIGADTSGEDNHWAVTNLAATDQTTDTPTNNFCTLNPLFGTTGRTFSEGNTHYAYDANWQKAAFASISVTAGKWYFEFRNETDSPIEVAVCNGTIANNGIWGTSTVADAGTYTLRQSNDAITWFTSTNTGAMYQNGSTTRTDLAQLGEDEIGMFAFDCATGKIWTGTNNAWDNSGDPAAGSNPSATWSTNFTAGELTWFAFGSEGDKDLKVNFGNPSWTISSSQADDNGYGNFEYDVPTGFLALCTKNLGSDGG